MRVQITVVVTDGDKPGGVARVDSTTLRMPPLGDADLVVANAARQVARRLGLGRPTPVREGGRG